jgi:hypothetical protein
MTTAERQSTMNEITEIWNYTGRPNDQLLLKQATLKELKDYRNRILQAWRVRVVQNRKLQQA